jgi:hypothetical protein
MSWEDRCWLGGLAAIVIWIFGVLPFLYGPPPRFREAGSPPQAHSEQPTQNASAEPRGSSNAPFFVQVLPTPKTAEERAQEAQERRDKSSTDWWLTIFTGAVALFNGMLVGATVLLWKAGERQLKLIEANAAEQSRDMKTSIEVAKKSADAAKAAAEIGQKALIETDRPWISVEAKIVGPLRFSENGIEITINVSLKNVGRSPATFVRLIRPEVFVDVIEANSECDEISRKYMSALLGWGVVLFPKEILPHEKLLIETSGATLQERAPAPMRPERGLRRPAIMIPAFYNLPGEYKSRHTISVFEIRANDPEHSGWDGSNSITPPEQLILRRHFLGGRVS